MLQLDIATIALDPRTDQPVLFMKPHRSPVNADRVLPITLGHPEATAILVALQGVHTPRPMTHDLLASIMLTLDVHLARVEISGFDRGTFFAELTLSMDGETFNVDARPSDAIALAVRVNAPVFIDDRVFQEASVLESSVNLADGQGGESGSSPFLAASGRTGKPRQPRQLTEQQAAEAEGAREQFREFLEGVKPDDF